MNDHEKENAKYIIELQDKINRLSPRQRTSRLRKLARNINRGGCKLSELPEYLALSENISVARAMQLATERMGDGSVQVYGTPIEGGPVQRLPASAFRTGKA